MAERKDFFKSLLMALSFLFFGSCNGGGDTIGSVFERGGGGGGGLISLFLSNE